LYNQPRMKAGINIALGTLAMLALALVVAAEPVAQLHPTDYVNDFAHVLDSSTIAQLDSVCEQVDHKAHAQIAVVTVKSLDGADVVSYSVDVYQKWGIGKKGDDRGVLILFAVQDHRYWTTVGYGLEPILPDGKVGGFGREAVPLLKQNDFNRAVALLTLRVADVIAKDAGIELTGPQPQAPAPSEEPSAGMSAGGIILIFVVILIVLLTPMRRILFWFLLFGGGGGGYGGGGGGWGGGGFGGGGGGFGGFGGGSTGGGGAGGSW
jgi:uncharacterized protein